ncbi:hypothetical protein [Clostridium sp.]|uniref:hypothetical protein n=1 Tax=Clostridium sp. TaxID=1506 RepID=UPI002611C2AA|nr:hypothetical protein [Clostridium sp.]
MNLLYYCWKLHDKWPAETIDRGFGEKIIISAFIEQEIEDKMKQMEALYSGGDD